MLLEIESNKQGLAGELRLAGVLDISTVDAFKNSLDYFQDVKELKIDFARLDFIDSTGIGGILEGIKRFQSLSISITIINISKDVYEIFDILGLPEVFGHDIFKANE